MTTLYHFASNVKPTNFGRGLLASRPSYRVDYSSSDAQWWASESSRLENARIEQQAGESAAMDRHEAGIA